MSRVVVVGNGMAGSRFVQELVARDLDRVHDVTVVGDEPGGAYNRVLLSTLLAGHTRADAVVTTPSSWYAAQGVALVAGRTVTAVDRTARCVHLDDGDALPYDTLVLATGSDAVLPPIDGLSRGSALIPGAALFRTLDDCVRIDAMAEEASEAVVLGAGVLGLEAARALAGRGAAVTVVQRGPRLMERQLDPGAATALRRELDRLGVHVVVGQAVTGVTGADRLDGVVLADGTVLPAQLLVLCCGVRPRTGLAVDAGLPVARGVLVDDELRSVGDPHVLAVGECAEHDGRTHGLVAPCWEQARVAASVLADPAGGARYRGSVDVVRLKADGLELAVLGDGAATADEDDPDVEVVRYADTGRGVYQKLVVRGGRLSSAILFGDTRTAGLVTQLFDRGAVLPPDRAGLVVPRRATAPSVVESPTALPASATVCRCNGVTKGAITGAWEDGARTVEELAARTRVTTGCGTCRDVVCGLVEWLGAADPDTATAPEPLAAPG